MNLESGVRFEVGDNAPIHSYWDLGLIMRSQASVSPPEPKLKLIDIPGRDEPLDFTEAFDGTVHYNQRTVTMSFMSMECREEWPESISLFLRLIHGKQCKVYLDSDPEFYYQGRCVCGTPTYRKHAWYIDVTCAADPYKYSIYSTIDRPPKGVDPYGDGIERYYADFEIGYADPWAVEFKAYGLDRPIVPRVYTHYEDEDGGALFLQNMTTGASDYVRSQEVPQSHADYYYDFVIMPGENDIVLTSAYKAKWRVSIEFRGMIL